MKVELNNSQVDSVYAALVAVGAISELSKADDVQAKADRTWSKIAGLFWKAQVRAEHLSGDTKVPEYYAAVKRAVIESWPANHQRLLAIKGHDVAELSDSEQGLRAKRQRDIGAYIGLIARHLRKLGDPKARGVKRAEAEAKVIESADPIVIIQGIINKATQIVDVADVDRLQNAGLEMIALIRKHRKA
jgi:hypothetical protein